MVSRRIVTAIAAVTIVAGGGPEIVAAAGVDGIVASDDEARSAHEAAVLVAREMVTIREAGGFAAGSPMSALTDSLDGTIAAVDLADFDRLEHDGHDYLETMFDDGISFSRPVYEALEPLPRGDRSRLDQGRQLSIDGDGYLHAIDHLLHHGGRAPIRPRPGPPIEVTAAALTAFVERGELAPQSPGAPEPPGGPIDVPYGRDRHGDSAGFPTWAIVAIAAAAGVAGWAIASRRRSAPSPDHRASDLLDAGRSFAEVHTVHEVEAIAAERAMTITGAEAAVYVRVTDDGFERGRSIGLEHFDMSSVGSSVVARTVATGREIGVVANDPAIGERRSVLAAPIVAAGHAAGVIVLTRRPGRPFDQDEIDTFAALRPLVGAALAGAMSRELIHTEAYVDSLTGLANRRSLDERLESVTGNVLVLMVDVDRFKLVNDVHGHQAGDVALRSVARTIEEAVGERGTAYRYGGEEFAIVLDSGDSAALGCVSERVRAAVEATPIEVDGTVLNLTVSIGTAWGDDPTDAIARADIALYEAKRSGRNRVVAAPGRLLEPTRDELATS